MYNRALPDRHSMWALVCACAFIWNSARFRVFARCFFETDRALVLSSTSVLRQSLHPLAGSPHRLALSKSINHARKLAASVRRQVSQVAGGGEASHTARKHEVETQASSAASCFKWSDGILVEALERGDWLVLDAANLCSPRSVATGCASTL